MHICLYHFPHAVAVSSHGRVQLWFSCFSVLLESSFVFLDDTIEVEEDRKEEGADKKDHQKITGEDNAGKDSHERVHEDDKHLTNHPTVQEYGIV